MSKDSPDGFGRSKAYEDEISIIELWLILARYKWLIVSAMVFSMALVVAAVLFKKEQYSYVSTIELASTNIPGAAETLGGVLVPLESSVVSLNKLNQVYIPLVLGIHRDKNKGLDIKISAARLSEKKIENNQLVVLTSIGSVPGAVQRVMHEEIVAMLSKDHDRLIAPQRRGLEHQLKVQSRELSMMQEPMLLVNNRQVLIDRLIKSEMTLERLEMPFTIEVKKERAKQAIEAAEQSLAELHRDEVLLTKRRSQFETERRLLEKEIFDLDGQIKQALQRSVSVVAGASEGVDGVALLLIDNVIQGNRSRLAALEQRLVIAFPERELVMENDLITSREARLQAKKKIDLMKKEFDLIEVEHKRSLVTTQMPVEQLRREVELFEFNSVGAIDRKLLQVEQLAFGLDAISPTRFFAPPMEGDSGQDFPLAAIVFAAFIGLIFGVLVAFFMEFLRAVSKRKAEVMALSVASGEGGNKVKLVSTTSSQANG
ncbi:hypothetical protein MNBD_GAMMA17-1759 [hydrothermal vent metagenome]|uniref:Polysaccharide chain length determinant N-terminal domain-containing protein n=1 Tax=hydrothermal vent metagenome TaxID=652676 RepID=A0A3B0ZX16_9ZZZZ